MLQERVIDNVTARLRGRDIPVRIRLWDGTEARLGDSPTVTITVPQPRALRHFINPSLDALGSAYVEGELDVDGCITDIIEIGNQLASKGPAGSAT